jgi:hypothetical protein
MKPFISEDGNFVIYFDEGVVTLKERHEILEARLSVADLEGLAASIEEFEINELLNTQDMYPVPGDNA